MKAATQHLFTAAAGAALAASLGAPALAGSHGVGVGAGVSGGVSAGVNVGVPPAGVPGGVHVPSAPNPGGITNPGNPNGTAPIGAPGTRGDTDRGHSEGKGNNDLVRGQRLIGKVASLQGSTLTLMLPNGTTKSFLVDPHAFGQMRPLRGKSVAIESSDGTRANTVVDADQTIDGSVTGMTKDSVTLRLPNGKTQTLSVAGAALAHMNLKPGTHVRVTSHDGGASASRIDRDRPSNGVEEQH